MAYREGRVFAEITVVEDLEVDSRIRDGTHKRESCKTYQKELRALGEVVGGLKNVGNTRREVPEVTRPLYHHVRPIANPEYVKLPHDSVVVAFASLVDSRNAHVTLEDICPL